VLEGLLFFVESEGTPIINLLFSQTLVQRLGGPSVIPFNATFVEALEEVADLRNYVAWEALRLDAEERTDEDADRERMLLRRTLAAAVEAYDALMLYRHARR
jgi:hypothetical protein